MNSTSTLRRREPKQDTSIHSWTSKHDLIALAAKVGTPLFVYSEQRLLDNAQRIQHAAKRAGLGARLKPFIPFFPNSNPHLLRPLQELGMGVLVQLPSEYVILRRFAFQSFIASPGYVSDKEIDYWAETGCPLFLSSLEEVSYLLKNHPEATINIRIDCLSSGKPGIRYGQIHSLAQLLQSRGRTLDSFEMYCGSGNSTTEMVGFLEQVFMVYYTFFSTVRTINLAGGYAFNYEAWDDDRGKHFDWDNYFQELHNIAHRYRVPESVQFIIEPARDLLADVGALIASVQRGIIIKPGANQLLTDGSRVLMPSAQYKERRHNVLFRRTNGNFENSNYIKAVFRGRGILRHEQILPGDYSIPHDIGPGDYLVILDVGAYCATQHMEFLNIPPAAEVLIDSSGAMHLISGHGDKLDKWRNLLSERRQILPEV